MKFGAVGEHLPDFLLARPAGLKDNVAAIRRPRGKIVTPAIVSELNPLLAGDIHQVNIGGARLAGAILADPGQSEELAVGRPVGRDRVTLVGHALLIGAIGFHGIDLRQSSAAANESDLRTGLAVPYGRNVRTFTGGHATKVAAAGITDINCGTATARGREREAAAIGRPRLRKIGTCQAGKGDVTIEIHRVHENVPTALGQGTESQT